MKTKLAVLGLAVPKMIFRNGTEYHQRACEKAESFLRTFEKQTQVANHDEERECNYKRNVYILMIIKSLVLYMEQGLAQIPWKAR